MAKAAHKLTPLIRQFSAGGAVYREEGKAHEWLIIRPAGRDSWRLPKGIIDKGETSLEAAQREVQEEAGVETEVLGKIGQDKYFYRLGKDRFYKTVTYFLMRYLQEAKGPISFETEEVAWLPFEEAQTKLTFPGEKGILQKAHKMVELAT
ncbi:NUDIX domain-containing protein [Candidatus Microgenomates bacterium]|nr:NUDIX domain-containing protein [Candidatus Microgenomates bacterium]